MKILVLNAGSSSIKYQLFDLPQKDPITKGLIEHIGEPNGTPTHDEAFITIQKSLIEEGIIQSFDEIQAIGHRVVHGGNLYHEATLITPAVLKNIEILSNLAPLHNPPNALGIKVINKLVPKMPQVAVFDTSFHQTMPPENYLYALPKALYETHNIRRYGFHGSSHHFVAQTMAQTLAKPLDQLNLITIHLGNGSSMCAIEKGQSIDTSMGFTPLEGLVMGTRSGDIDAAIIKFLTQHAKMSLEEVDAMLNKESGLKGLIGSNDMRDLLQAVEKKDPQAQTALKLYTNRIKKYIGAYMALLGRVDAIVFTGGIGEHASLIRAVSLEYLENFGITLDPEKNEHVEGLFKVSAEQSRVQVWVIPTNEELYIAQQTFAVIQALND